MTSLDTTGQIPEAPETYNAIAYHGGMNEHQLAISETTFGGLSILGGQKGLIDYGTLMDLALQRCKTAREAITFIDQILKDHGYVRIKREESTHQTVCVHPNLFHANFTHSNCTSTFCIAGIVGRVHLDCRHERGVVNGARQQR